MFNEYLNEYRTMLCNIKRSWLTYDTVCMYSLLHKLFYISWSMDVMLVAINVQNLRCKKSRFKTYHHLLDLLKRKFRAQPLQPNLKELKRVIHQICAAIPQQYIHWHILSMSTRCLNYCRCDTGWMLKVLERN